jgi:hypothetical protein
MITAIVLYDLPPSIGLEECREHFTRIAPDFLKAKGFLRKQFICRKEGGVAGGVYMWESEADARAFYTGPWRDGIRARYGNDPKVQYFETVALTDKATGKAGGFRGGVGGSPSRRHIRPPHRLRRRLLFPGRIGDMDR